MQNQRDDFSSTPLFGCLNDLVYRMRTLHNDDKLSKLDTQILQTLWNQEQAELNLISTATHENDSIGLFSLLSVFWCTRNQLLRKVHELEKRLCAADSLDSVVKRSVESLITLRNETSCQISVKTKIESNDERSRALDWHIQQIESGSLADVIDCSVAIQREYQKLHRAFHNPVLEPNNDIAATQSVARSSIDAQESLHLDLTNILTRYSAAMNDFVIPPICKFLQDDAQDLAPTLTHNDVLECTSHTSSDKHSSGVWRLVKFTVVDANVGDTFRVILERSGMKNVGEESLRSIFCVSRELIVDREDLWMPQDPRLISQDTIHGTGTKKRQFSSQLDNVLRQDLTLFVRVVVPLQGVSTALTTLSRQQGQLKGIVIPNLRLQLKEKKKQLWDAEIESIEARTKSPGSVDFHEKIRVCQQDVKQLEGRIAHAESALSQTDAHHRALLDGNLSALSAMLIASTPWNEDSLFEREVYVCKEIPTGMSLEAFARSLNMDMSLFHVVEDFGSNPRKSMVYFPIRMPATSVVEQDQELVAELETYEKQFPSFPPNTELLEQISALRRCDVNALSALLTASRRRRDELELAPQVKALMENVCELQNRLKAEEETVAFLRKELKLKEAQRDSCKSGTESLVPKEYAHILETTPFEAIKTLIDVLRNKDADITVLQNMLSSKHAKEAEDQKAKVTVSNSHLELVTEGLRRELRDETRRAVEITARCVQLENSLESSSRELCVTKAELEKSVTDVKQCKAELNKTIKLLRESDSRLRAMEREFDELERKSFRQCESFVAKEIPCGLSPREYVESLGIHGTSAELILQNGVVFDALRNVHLIYVPVKVDRAKWSSEDANIQQEIEAASRSAVVSNTHEGLVDLLSHLSALRAGDTVHLSEMARSYRQKSVELAVALVTSQQMVDTLKIDLQKSRDGETPEIFSIVDENLSEENDFNWTTIKGGKAKVALLRAALKQADAECAQWKSVCDEYQINTRNTASEESKHALEQRCAAIALLLEARDAELRMMRDTLTTTDSALNQCKKQLEDARSSAAGEINRVVVTMSQQLDAERANHAQDIAQMEERLCIDSRRLKSLQDALVEMGVEVVENEV